MFFFHTPPFCRFTHLTTRFCRMYFTLLCFTHPTTSPRLLSTRDTYKTCFSPSLEIGRWTSTAHHQVISLMVMNKINRALHRTADRNTLKSSSAPLAQLPVQSYQGDPERRLATAA